MNVEKLVSIQIPVKLKKQLVDDSEFVTHLGKVMISGLISITSVGFNDQVIWGLLISFALQLVKLPRTPNVDDIMKKYLEYRLKKDAT